MGKRNGVVHCNITDMVGRSMKWDPISQKCKGFFFNESVFEKLLLSLFRYKIFKVLFFMFKQKFYHHIYCTL